VEPNDDLSTAQKLSIPSTVNGHIAPPDSAAGRARRVAADQDVFRFSARKGQTLIFDVAAQQLKRLVRCRESYLDIRMRSGERRQARDQPAHRECGQRIHAQHAPAPASQLLLGRDGDPIERGGAFAPVLLACGRQRHSAPMTLEQPPFEPGLEDCDVAADCRRGDTQFLGCLCKAGQTGRGLEGRQ